jgi:hypothetical protein
MQGVCAVTLVAENLRPCGQVFSLVQVKAFWATLTLCAPCAGAAGEEVPAVAVRYLPIWTLSFLAPAVLHARWSYCRFGMMTSS